LGTRTPGKNDVRLYRDHLGICRYGFRSLYALGCHYPIRARYGRDLWISSDRSPRVAAPQADATSPHISDPLGCLTAFRRSGIPLHPGGMRMGQMYEMPTSSRWKVPHWKSLNTGAFMGINPQNVAQLKVNERFVLKSTNYCEGKLLSGRRLAN